MIISRRDIVLGLALACAGQAAWASVAGPPAPLAPEDARDVVRIIDYLQGLTNGRGRFVQTDPRGSHTEGTFYLQRPGRARFDYDPPSGLVIASNGHTVSVVDRRLKTIQAYPLALTPLALVLARDIRIDRGVIISQVIRTDGQITVVAEDGQRKARGRIAISFAAAPLTLTGWAVTDARGAVVRVRLIDFASAAPHEAAFFQLADPRLTAAPDAPP